MTDALTASLEEIRAAGLEVLARELGPVGLVRFIQQFEGGRGDYTRERANWLAGARVEDVVRSIRPDAGAR